MDAPEKIVLHLEIADTDLVEELAAHEAGGPRDAFALTALRIGILALKQAGGRLDADAVRREGDRLLELLQQRLSSHQDTVTQGVTKTLTEYFDPRSGKLSERIERLVRKDGDLERLLQAQLGRDDSQLARTLTAHVGEGSPLMKVLSPDETKGILARLAAVVEATLKDQKDQILAQFSLDNEDSALTRLVGRVEKSQGKITDEFSLDNERSALARLKRELVEILKEHKKDADAFRVEVTEKFAAFLTRREAEAKSPAHGVAFESAVWDVVLTEAQRLGDVAESTGASAGLVKNCKVGDFVVTLGPDAVTPGAKIAGEAKEAAAYDLAKALDEIELAKKNRGASVGLFVFSRKTAPAGLEPLQRIGTNVVAVWDAEDDASVILKAALSVARAVCLRAEGERKIEKLDFEPAEKAVRAVEKLAGGVEEIRGSAETIKSNTKRILHRAELMAEELERQVARLDKSLEKIKFAFQKRAESGGD